MTVELRRFTKLGEFLATAGEFLAQREAEHNLMLGLCSTIAAHPTVYRDPWFLAVVDGDRVVAAAMQTPPYNLIVSEMDVEVVEPIIDAIITARCAVPGVLGPTRVTERFAECWQARNGCSAAIEMRERIFRIDRVSLPRPASGACRIASEDDRELLAEWWWAFRVEAMPRAPQKDDRYEVADRWVKRIGRTIYLWQDDDVVALAGVGGETPSGTRIGPVYTPVARRGRGYASNLVAAVTQQQLDAGRRFCFLFTDLANPTSNKIYQALGYVPVTDVDQYRFTSAADRST